MFMSVVNQYSLMQPNRQVYPCRRSCKKIAYRTILLILILYFKLQKLKLHSLYWLNWGNLIWRKQILYSYFCWLWIYFDHVDNRANDNLPAIFFIKDFVSLTAINQKMITYYTWSTWPFFKNHIFFPSSN